MNSTQCRPTSSSVQTAVLSSVFFLSGFSALVYQVVWQRLLTLHYGVGAISITIIVTIFMGGLGLGAIIGGRFAGSLRNGLLFYAGIELLIGVFGLGSFGLLDMLGRHTAGSALPVAFLCISLFLVVPTTLMGMTLPVLARIYNALVSDFALTISQLYFINTMGAAVGSLAAAYGLITFGGLDTALQVAAAVNGVMGILILTCWKRADRAALPAAEPPVTPANHTPHPVFPGLPFVVLATGFFAIGYEIIWFRLLGIMFKGSPYAFATILSVYLAGIAFGSLWISRRLARGMGWPEKQGLLFGLQVLIALYVLLSFLAFYWTSDIPPFKWLQANTFASPLHPPRHWRPIHDGLEFFREIFVMADVVFWPFAFAFVPALLMGATFPLASVLGLRNPKHDAATVGHIYAWTILGNVLGGLVTGFVLLPFLGTEYTLQLFIAGGVLFLFPLFKRMTVRHPVRKAAFAVAALFLLVGTIFPGRHALYAAIHPNFGYGTVFIEEGREGLVFTYANGDRIHNVINGMVHGGRPNEGFVREAIETLSYARRVKRVLVIGYGTGQISDTLLLSRELEELMIVELNHALMANLRKIPLFRTSLFDPRIHLEMDDGRRYLNREPGKFDAILMDAIYYQSAYSNNLYSRQFFQLAAGRLTADGVLMVWADEHGIIPHTIASVFPYVRKYGGSSPGTHGFYLASSQPMSKDPTREAALLLQHDPATRQRISEAASYSGDRALVERISIGLPVNEDWKPRTEYYLGLQE